MSKVTVFRTAYDGHGDAASLHYGTVTDDVADPSRTVQSARDDADINVIVKRFGLTGVAPQTTRTPRYEDYAETFDFQSSMNILAQAKKAFSELPSGLRKRFGNDPQEYLAFVSDPKNADEAVKLGIAELRKVVDKPIMDVRIVPEAENGSSRKEKDDVDNSGKSGSDARASGASSRRSSKDV